MKGELKDYETYKDVMEQTFQRMKSDIEQLQIERDEWIERSEKRAGGIRGAKSEITKLKKENACVRPLQDMSKV